MVRDGRASRVPYGRVASAIVVLAERDGGWGVGLSPAGQYEGSTPGENLAHEPRDLVAFRELPELKPAPGGIDAEVFRLRGALLRSIQLCGALDRVLDLTVKYAGEREQFGVTLSRFQAVQAMLSNIATETAAAHGAVEVALKMPSPFTIAAAKSRTGEAAGVVASAGHQVHGAIGFTEEHMLHYSTRRLWAWRDEYGTESRHAEALGNAVAALGADRIWEFLTEL